MNEEFKKELTHLINQHSIESVTDVPDFILAEMICRMIEAMGPSIKKTLDWHGCDSGWPKASSRNSNGDNLDCLVGKLPEECARVRELVGIYKEHCGTTGGLAVSLMERALQRADRAMISGDLQAMIVAYQDLQGFTE